MKIIKYIAIGVFLIVINIWVGAFIWTFARELDLVWSNATKLTLIIVGVGEFLGGGLWLNEKVMEGG